MKLIIYFALKNRALIMLKVYAETSSQNFIRH
jgi:hypothetical protein